MIKNRIFIGRNEDNDIVVPAACNVVSGSHADLKLLDSGEYLYSDHSTNGSTVKGKNIRNEAVAVSFGTPIVLATRFALDWEQVRQLLPPEPPKPKEVVLQDWRKERASHPADLAPEMPQAEPAAPQPQPEPNKPRRNVAKIIILICVGATLLLAAAIALIFFLLLPLLR